VFATIAAVLLIAAGPALASPPNFDKTEIKCRLKLAKTFSKLVKIADKVSARCHKLRNKGKISEFTDCNDLSEADDKQKLAKTEQKLHDAVQKKCIDKGVDGDIRDQFVSCPEPCATETGVGNPIATYDELADCLACYGGSIVEARNTAILGNPSVITLTKDGEKCHKILAKGYGKLLTISLKEGVKCQKDADKAGIFDIEASGCESADPKGKIAKALMKAEDKLDKKCSALADLGELDSCDDFDLASLKACLAIETDFATSALLPAHYQLDPTICPQSVTTFIRAGVGQEDTTASFLDVGWTGQSHGADIDDGYTLTGDVTCGPSAPPCGVCSIDGVSTSDPQFSSFARCRNDFSVECSNLFASDPACGGAQCVFTLGPPLAISAGNNPTCSINVLAADISGTADIELGSSTLDVDLKTLVHTGGTGTLTRPCPVCLGDIDARDGSRDGVCVGGNNDGDPCDSQAFDATFAPAPSEGLSLDCVPGTATNISGTGLTIGLNLTTGNSSLPFANPCDSPLGFLDCACGVCTGDSTQPCRDDSECASAAAGTCASHGSGVNRQPNQCSDLTCTAIGDDKGECQGGPLDRSCDGLVRANGDGFLKCLENADCDAISTLCPGNDCGDCSLTKLRPCFLDPIAAQGIADPDDPLLVSTFCIPPTNNAAINGTSGLPGPARVAVDSLVTLNY
jgi:hypothetical protein